MPRTTTTRTPRKRTAIKSAVETFAPHATPSSDAIAARAYTLYCERGSQHGRDLEDWLQAERELASANAA
jgi:hypothetical protein